MTTAECLLNRNRNPLRSQSEIEQELKDKLGVQKVLWIPRGVYHDETGGHVDNMACFARPGVVLLNWTDDISDPQFERSAEALQYLEGQTDAVGRPLRIVKVPMPTPMYYTAEEANARFAQHKPGERMAGSYINCYICNGGVIIPSFGVPEDQVALKLLSKVFWDRRVVPVSTAREILIGGGNIHCITQQQPDHAPAVPDSG